MATRQRNPSPSIIETLREKPYEFEYYQALRILERLDLETTPLGEGFIPSNENIDLKSRVFLDWPPSDLYKLQSHYQENLRYKLSINFFGLAGAPGPLPLPYTEKIMERNRSKDHGFEEFLNIFNHRLLSILYRIRKKYWVGLDFKKPDQTKISKALFSLIGLQTGDLRNRLQIPDRALLYYSGLFWQKPPSLQGCEAILKHYFKVGVKISPFKGKWQFLDKSQYTRIGFTGAMQVLGDTAALGHKVWNSQGYIDVKLGPLTFDQFQGFLKNGAAYTLLTEILTLYLSPSSTIRIRLSILGKEVKTTYLGQNSKLGWTTWISDATFSSPDEQVLLYSSTPLANITEKTLE